MSVVWLIEKCFGYSSLKKTALAEEPTPIAKLKENMCPLDIEK